MICPKCKKATLVSWTNGIDVTKGRCPNCGYDTRNGGKRK